MQSGGGSLFQVGLLPTCRQPSVARCTLSWSITSGLSVFLSALSARPAVSRDGAMVINVMYGERGICRIDAADVVAKTTACEGGVATDVFENKPRLSNENLGNTKTNFFSEIR